MATRWAENSEDPSPCPRRRRWPQQCSATVSQPAVSPASQPANPFEQRRSGPGRHAPQIHRPCKYVQPLGKFAPTGQKEILMCPYCQSFLAYNAWKR